MALTTLAFAAHITPAASKQQNTPLRVALTFAALGAFCGGGHGVLVLCAAAAFNLFLGLVGWRMLIHTIPVQDANP